MCNTKMSRTEFTKAILYSITPWVLLQHLMLARENAEIVLKSSMSA